MAQPLFVLDANPLLPDPDLSARTLWDIPQDLGTITHVLVQVGNSAGWHAVANMNFSKCTIANTGASYALVTDAISNYQTVISLTIGEYTTRPITYMGLIRHQDAYRCSAIIDNFLAGYLLADKKIKDIHNPARQKLIDSVPESLEIVEPPVAAGVSSFFWISTDSMSRLSLANTLIADQGKFKCLLNDESEYPEMMAFNIFLALLYQVDDRWWNDTLTYIKGKLKIKYEDLSVVYPEKDMRYHLTSNDCSAVVFLALICTSKSYIDVKTSIDVCTRRLGPFDNALKVSALTVDESFIAAFILHVRSFFLRNTTIRNGVILNIPVSFANSVYMNQLQMAIGNIGVATYIMIRQTLEMYPHISRIQPYNIRVELLMTYDKMIREGGCSWSDVAYKNPDLYSKMTIASLRELPTFCHWIQKNRLNSYHNMTVKGDKLDESKMKRDFARVEREEFAEGEVGELTKQAFPNIPKLNTDQAIFGGNMGQHEIAEAIKKIMAAAQAANQGSSDD